MSVERCARALGEADPLESFRKAPRRVARLLRGVGEKRLARAPAPGRWSVKEVVAHLADGEVVLGARLRMVAAHDRPAIPAYDQDLFVQRLGVGGARTARLLEDFAAVRAANVRLLRRLPPEAFARVGLHAERGEESLAAMLRLYAGHDRVHEAQIARTLAELAERKRAKARAGEQPAPKAPRKRKARRAQGASEPAPAPAS